MADQTADEIKKANIAKMGEALGAQFSELRQELIRTYVKWAEFIDLFGSKKETVDLLNRAASFHFRIAQDVLWESLILHIARLIDPPKTAGQPNLTVKNLPELISDAGLRSRVNDAVAVALKACEFSLNWRHKIFAHNDLDVALKNPARAVPTAERQQVDAALKALADVLNALEAHYHEGTTTAFNLAIRKNGATTLLSVLDSGIKAREEEIKRLTSEIHAADFLVQPVTASKKKTSDHSKLKARLPRGLADRGPAEIAATRTMVEAIRTVFERYGFEPVETPAFEYTDALGKFLPDQDRPNEGVFSFQDDDEQWLSLRYDLTAPLARYVAERIGTEHIVLPYRSYRVGYVYRNEKPGPGRFRQFMQFDADTVGAPTMAADAEMCMLAADTMEALGVPRGSYVVKVNNRKVLDGVMEAVGLGGETNDRKRLTVLRALDKFDRLGRDGVRLLLGPGRKDESGDFTNGAGLSEADADRLLGMLFRSHVKPLLRADSASKLEIEAPVPGGKDLFYSNRVILGYLRDTMEKDGAAIDGVTELAEIAFICDSAGYGPDRILIDTSVVRGLEYYTGPVYEVELTFEINDEKGRPVRFGSVGGGGRYDGLVSRFRGEPVPATGFSIGVSRLQAALTALGKLDSKPAPGPVVVTVFDRDRVADYQKMVASLRAANIRAELYLGNPKNIGNQLKYADKRASPCVVIQGGDEKLRGEVMIKDLILGAGLTAIKDRDEYLKKQAEAQFAVKEAELVEAVAKLLARHGLA